MTDREVMRQALLALEGWDNYGKWAWPDTALEQSKRNTTESLASLRAALEQQAEPECWCHKCNENRVINNIPFSMTRMIVCPTCGNKRCPKASDHRLDCTDSNAAGQPGSVYTTPPQRQWVGLTDEEIKEIALDTPIDGTNFARAIEAKLKERNNG